MQVKYLKILNDEFIIYLRQNKNNYKNNSGCFSSSLFCYCAYCRVLLKRMIFHRKNTECCQYQTHKIVEMENFHWASLIVDQQQSVTEYYANFILLKET